MPCYGCYKKDIDGYCLDCRKRLFDGHRVNPVLPFETPTADNLEQFQQKTKRLSISGVQLKYLLKREQKDLILVEKGGTHILKPIPPSTQLANRDQAPENEHLTMQIAAQLFDIGTAANGLLYFKDGAPAYLTKRFDVNPSGGKFQQEDMAQLSGRSQQTHGETFKYDGTYQEIGQLIQKYVAAYPPALEQFFRLVVYNYLFSNGDAHLKNFSLLQAATGEYTLSPAYDLMSTIMHTPLESDTALDLYPGSMDSPFYSSFGYYGQAGFRILANKLGIVPVRRERILTQLLSSSDMVMQMIDRSFLDDGTKAKYRRAYREKLARMGMTKEMIGKVINERIPAVYAPTTEQIKLRNIDNKELIGYFYPTDTSDNLEKDNQYTFIETRNSAAFRSTKDSQFVTIVNGDLITGMQY